MPAFGRNPLQHPTGALRLLVTGATGGLGQALVHELLSRYEVRQLVAVGRSEAKLADLKAAAPHAVVQPYLLPEFSDASLSALAATLAAGGASLDLWLHCVGSLLQGGLKVEKSLRDVDEASLMAAFRINALSFLLAAKHLKPLFRGAGGAVIAALSAKVGSIGDNQLGGWYGYRMSKAALNMGVHNTALELRRSGCASICVAVHPGTTQTELSAPFTAGYQAERLYAPKLSAQRIVAVLAGLTSEHNGGFLNWDGTPLPW